MSHLRRWLISVQRPHWEPLRQLYVSAPDAGEAVAEAERDSDWLEGDLIVQVKLVHDPAVST